MTMLERLQHIRELSIHRPTQIGSPVIQKLAEEGIAELRCDEKHGAESLCWIHSTPLPCTICQAHPGGHGSLAMMEGMQK